MSFYSVVQGLRYLQLQGRLLSPSLWGDTIKVEPPVSCTFLLSDMRVSFNFYENSFANFTGVAVSDMLLGLCMMYPFLTRDISMCIHMVSKLYILSIYAIYWYFVYVFLSHEINVCVLWISCC